MIESNASNCCRGTGHSEIGVFCMRDPPSAVTVTNARCGSVSYDSGVPLLMGACNAVNCCADCQVLREAENESARHRDLGQGRPGMATCERGESWAPRVIPLARTNAAECICSRMKGVNLSVNSSSVHKRQAVQDFRRLLCRGPE